MSPVRIQYCSFCGKSLVEVEHLVSGPGNLFICDECIELCIAAVPRLKAAFAPTPNESAVASITPPTDDASAAQDESVVTDAMVTLAECPVGLFLDQCGGLCLKTEYGNNEGRIDAYIVSSGEFFWGTAPQTIKNQRTQLVTPVDEDAVLTALRAAQTKETGKVSRLSMDAKALAGAVWGLPIGRKSSLTYERAHAIWPRTRAALTRLVDAGYIEEKRSLGKVTFTARQSCAEFVRFATKADLTLSAMPESDAP